MPKARYFICEAAPPLFAVGCWRTPRLTPPKRWSHLTRFASFKLDDHAHNSGSICTLLHSILRSSCRSSGPRRKQSVGPASPPCSPRTLSSACCLFFACCRLKRKQSQPTTRWPTVAQDMKQDLKRQLHNLTDHAAKEHAEAQRKHERK